MKKGKVLINDMEVEVNIPDSLIPKPLKEVLKQGQHDELVNELGFKKVKTRCPVCYTTNEIRSNLESAIEWLKEWKLVSSEYPNKTNCDNCKKPKGSWFQNGKRNVCNDCLINEAFEGVMKK